MRKFYFISAITALSLAGCSSDEYLGGEGPNSPENPTQSKAIAFGGKSFATTRADHVGADAAGLLDKNFVVEGIKVNGTTQTEVFDHYNVNYEASTANTTESNTADWEYVGKNQIIKGLTTKLSKASAQTIKYWDFSTTQYDFVAVSMGKGTGATPTYAKLSEIKYANLGKAVTTDDAVYTLTGSAEELAASYIADLVTKYNRDGISEYETTVTPKFRSLGTKVRLAFYETVPGYSVKNVKFYNVAWDGTTPTTTAGATDATLFAENGVFPSATSKGTMSVYFPTVGFDKKANPDYNQAHIKFAAGSETGDALVKTKTFGEMDYKASKEGSEADVKYLGRTSNEATYAGVAANNYYTIVLPLGTSDNLQIRVEYDLVPIDGAAETIHVRDARAVVPAAYADWKPNYAYTYIFKISDATNGWTGTKPNPNYDPTDPDSPETVPVEGLTPITFDAVVVDTEDGLQETITTITTPSITTYQEGAVVTTGSEYKAGDIYATVMNGTTQVDLSTLTAPAGVAVYTATTTNTTEGITEATVTSKLMGNNNGITLTSCGYDIVDNVPTADGNTVEVSAAKFTVASGKTYVFLYTDGSKNYVKVIKVQ